MKTKTNTKQSLLICLVVELVTLLIGLEFFNPFQIGDLSKDMGLFRATIILYLVACGCGIFTAAKSKVFDDTTHMFNVIVLCGLLFFMAPTWPIILGMISIFTIIMLITKGKTSSKSWGLFLVLIKNKNI